MKSRLATVASACAACCCSRFSTDAFHAPGSVSRPFSPSAGKVGPEGVKLLDQFGNGTFGGVYYAVNEDNSHPLIAKCARAATSDERARQNAASYLEIEAAINSKLCGDSKQNDQRHVAPYVGESQINGTTFLLWERSGEYTLEDYIEMDDGWYQLAIDMGIAIAEFPDDQSLHNELAEQVLRQLLEGVAYCHSLGIVHRDIKPSNVLVDPETHTLRYIDFGSACCLNTWAANKLGYKGPNKGPRSILYCPPEEFVDEEHPYAFDIYSTAVTWLRVVLSDDAAAGDDAQNECQDTESCGLGDEDDLFKWRISVRDFGHDLVEYEEFAASHGSLPFGWYSLFGTSRRGISALRLLSRMMEFRPSERICAAEALTGPYLNADCGAEAPPVLPPASQFSLKSHLHRWKVDKDIHGECKIEDLFTEVVAVELDWPLEIVLEPYVAKKQQFGARVSSAGHSATSIRIGDRLLAIGSVDVENVPFQHIIELLGQWQHEKPISLLLIRDAG